MNRVKQFENGLNEISITQNSIVNSNDLFKKLQTQ